MSAAAAVAALAACAVLTARQLALWHDSVSLFRAYPGGDARQLRRPFVVGDELLKQGQPDEAWEHLLEARIGDTHAPPAVWERRGPIEPYSPTLRPTSASS